MMLEEYWQQIAAPLTAILFVVIGRLIDKWLPDPENKHPLPEPPAAKPEQHKNQ